MFYLGSLILRRLVFQEVLLRGCINAGVKMSSGQYKSLQQKMLVSLGLETPLTRTPCTKKETKNFYTQNANNSEETFELCDYWE